MTPKMLLCSQPPLSINSLPVPKEKHSSCTRAPSITLGAHGFSRTSPYRYIGMPSYLSALIVRDVMCSQDPKYPGKT